MDEIKRRTRRNRKKASSSTGYKGVYFVENCPEKPYKATLTIYNKYTGNTKTVYIGFFATAEEANLQRIKFISELF